MDENQTNDEQQQQAQEAGEAASGEGAALPADSTSGSATELSAAPALSGDATAEGQLTGTAGEQGNVAAGVDIAGAAASSASGAPGVDGTAAQADAGNADAPKPDDASSAKSSDALGIDATGDAGNVLTLGDFAGSGADGQTREVVLDEDPSFVQVEQARLMAHIAVARSHLASLESDVVRNVMAALDAIERLVHED